MVGHDVADYFRNIKVGLVDHMGSDLSVVNAARVSFDKASEWDKIDCGHEDCGPECSGYFNRLSDRDAGLIRYLAEHNHWTPFGHASATFRISAPIFVARQLVKHQVGLVWNEVSRRYVQGDATYFQPSEWRAAVKDKKQGSGAEITGGRSTLAWLYFLEAIAQCDEAYRRLLGVGVCPEQARMVLPLAMMTEWVWTGSLFAWARVANLRLKPDAQVETQMVAEFISMQMGRLFPVSWKELTKDVGEQGRVPSEKTDEFSVSER